MIDETCHIESLNRLQKIVDILTLLVAYLRALCERIASLHLLARRLRSIKGIE